MNTFDSLRSLSMSGALWILLVFAYVPAVFGIWDCDEDRDCRGFGANYKCNKNAAPGGQCELSGTRDEFFGAEGDLGID